jgi:dipeptidyl aminopeptidase/acylaminoacyl peptidase
VATTARYGRWASPFAAADVARAKVSLSELCSDGEALYWLESRPAEAGRVVLVRAGNGTISDHSPPGVSIRSRVNEYGGGALSLVPGHAPGAFAYVDQSDQRVWICDGPAETGAGDAATKPRPLSAAPPEGVVHTHGGLGVTPDGDWVLAVREAHRQDSRGPQRCIVAFGTRADAAPECVVLEGHDFFGAPRVDSTGERLAVVAWDHPDMPWDASQLLVVSLARHGEPGSSTASLRALGQPRVVAGGPDESVGQPVWGHDGRLRFVSDRAGWWQPYCDADPAPVRLADTAAEFHGPDWVLGQSTFAELRAGSLAARMTTSGRDALVIVDPVPGADGTSVPRVLEQPCVSIAAVCEHQGGLALIGTTPDTPSTVWVWRAETRPVPIRPPAATALGPADVAVGEPFDLEGRSGRPVYGTLYRPVLSGTEGPRGDSPPLVVWCHGGPTSACQAGLDLTVQFFTTRGFAVACVDYAGSSGYGRDYRCALWGKWGVADSEDCLDAALHLAARGDVDSGRLAIRGSSAGGMTALNALAAGEGFGACASWYGVTDLMGLVATTHDFEAHYTDRLIGPLPGAEHLYDERSPRNQAPAMRGSVLLLQGTEDAVVPPSQAEGMRESLDAAGVRCDLRFFEGEGHGFRRADTLTDCLEAELAFYLAELHLADP